MPQKSLSIIRRYGFPQDVKSRFGYLLTTLRSRLTIGIEKQKLVMSMRL